MSKDSLTQFRIKVPPTDPEHVARLADIEEHAGKSAYELAVESGFEGTLEDWLAALVGPRGPQGAPPPVGTVMAFGTEEPPEGYLELNGAILDEFDYPDLIAAAPGFAVSNEDGTFTLADLRGRFLRGIDSAGAIDPDGAARAIGSEQLDALQNIAGHIGLVEFYGVSTNSGPFYSTNWWALAGQYRRFDYTNYTGTPGSSDTGISYRYFDGSRAARTSEETRPRNVAVLFCVKY
jgi:hypothetical protein